MANTKNKIPDNVKIEASPGAEADSLDNTIVDEITDDSVVKTTKRKSIKSTKPAKPVTTRMIRATSKVSTSLDDVWYSFEFSETREVHDDENIEEARMDLWNTVHTEVDNQVAYTIESIKGSAPQQSVPGTVNNNYNIPPEYDY